MAVQLIIRSTDGSSRVLSLDNGASYEVRPGDRVEVVTPDGQVAKAVVQGDHVVVKTFSGETVQLSNFMQTIQGTSPAELVMPEPRQLQLRVTDENGNQQIKTIKPGEKFSAAPGQHVEVLGASIPNKFEARGKDITFVTAKGDRFTIANVAGEDGAPRPDKVSFPDLYQFGGLASGSSSTLNLLPLTMVPLGFDATNTPRFQSQGDAGDGVRYESDGDGDGDSVAYEQPTGTAGGTGDGAGGESDADPAPVVPPAPQPTPIQITEADFRAANEAAPPLQPPAPGSQTEPEPPAPPASEPPLPPATGEEPAPPEKTGVEVSRSPDAPVITGLTPSTDTGASATDGVTNVAMPTVTGTATAGLTVRVLVDGVEAGTAQADANGQWSYTFVKPILDGAHTLTAIAESATAGVSGASAGLPVQIDTTAPGGPVIAGLTAATDTGESATDSLTADARPTIVGTAEAGGTVQVYDGATLVGTAVADANGDWSLDVPSSLADGAHALTAHAVDTLGNVSVPSAVRVVTIDTTAPAAPVVTGLTASTDTGASQTDALTRLPAPTLIGTAEANSTVEVYDGATLLGTVRADLNGNWSLPLAAPLAEGVHAVTAIATDAAGNTGPASVARSVTVDSAAPAAPVITGLTPATDTGASDTDGVTSLTQPTVTGTAEAHATVEIYDGATLLGTATAGADGAWSLPVPAAMAEGAHSLTAVAIDAAGNQSPASAPRSVTIDATAPAAPVISGLTVATDTGVSRTDGVTANNKPTVVGTAEAHSTVAVYDGATLVGTATADANGAWSLDVASPFADGAHTLTAVATDAAGNDSPASAGKVITVATVKPAAPVVTGLTPATDTGVSDSDALTHLAQPTVAGTAVPSAEVAVYEGTTLLGKTTSDATGSWSLPLSGALTEGVHEVHAVVTDAIGNTSLPSATKAITVDLTAPAAPTVTRLTPATDTGASDSDGLTQLTQPTVEGTATPNDTVEVYAGDTLIGEAPVGADGTWSLSIPSALADGPHAITAKAVDPAGNASAASEPLPITIDATAPVAPTVSGLTAATDTGASATDAITSDDTPTLVGTAEADATVHVYDGTTLLGTVSADGAGDWQLPLTSALSEGLHNITATATDAAGNVSGASATRVVSIITAAPAAPVVTGLTTATDTGVSDTDGLTRLSTPTVTGTALPNGRVEIYDGTTLLGTADADENGDWSLPLTEALTEGDHDLTATVTDAAGNVSDASAVKTITIDASAPAAPVITGLTTATDSGASQTDGLTNVTTPTVTGTAEANATVKVYEGTTLLGTTNADDNGDWSLALTSALSDDVHTLTATATDAAGNTSPSSTAKTITVDTASPAAPVISGLTAATDTGASHTDGLTSVTTPTVVGTAEANATVKVYEGTTLVGTTTADPDGNWSLSLTSPLSTGAHSLTATATDAAGNTSADSAAKTVTIDTAAPAAPTISGLTTATDTGVSDTDGITADNTPTVVGTAEASSIVNVYDGTALLGTTTADANGDWSLDLTSALSDGVHTLTATSTDAAGNVSDPSASKSITVDTVALAAPTITGLTTATDSGASDSDRLTNVTKPTVVGTAAPGATVEVYDGTTLLGTATANPDGDWSLAVDTALTEGAHSLTAVAVDVAGNESEPSAAKTVTIDTIAPAAPTVAGLTAATDSGASSSDAITSDPTPTVTGTAEANASVKVYDGTTLLGTTTADTDGKWSLDLASALSNGDHTLTATSTDAAGNVSDPSASKAITIDAAAPAAPTVTGLSTATDSGASSTDRLTNVTKPTLTGTAEANATVKVYEGTNLLGTTSADENGDWSLPLESTLIEGPHEIHATVTDAAGNVSESSATKTVTIDTTAPDAPVVSGLTAATDTGADDTDGVTSEAQPTIVGTAEANATVKVYDGTNLLGTTTADENGAWSLDLTSALSDGPHAITAKATDAAGNESAASSSKTITVTTSGPDAPTVTGLTTATDSGSSNTDGLTNVTQPTITGTAIANGTVKVYDGTTLLGTATADENGAWSLPLESALSNGPHQIHATATDGSGNTSAASTTKAITIDADGPAKAVVTGLTTATDSGASATDAITNVVKPTVVGTAEANATVKVYDGTTLLGTTTADENGAWSLPLENALAESVHTLTAAATDAAGNTGAASDAKSVTIDVTAPGKPTVTGLTAATDTGTSSTDGITSLTQPTIVGTAEAGATVEVYDGTTLIGTTTADADSKWSLDLSATAVSLANGAHSLTAKATDVAGNESVASDATSVTVENASLTKPVITGLTPYTDTGVSDTDGITNDATPTLRGTAPANTTVKVYEGTTLIGTATADGAGAWTLAIALAEGAHTLTAVASDLAGNESPTSDAKTITTVTTLPAAPTVTGLTAETDTAGASNSDGLTADATPTIVGTAVADATVLVYAGGTLLGTAVADANGDWSLPLTTPMADGTYSLTAKVVDAAGNTSAASTSKAVTIDTAAPAMPVVLGITTASDSGASATDQYTNVKQPTIHGTAEPGATVKVYDGTALIGTVAADADGNWSLPVGADLLEGPHTITATATDAAGNLSPVSPAATFTVDSVAPAAPVVTGPTALTDTGASATDGITSEAAPTLAGTAEAGAVVSVYEGTTLLGTTQADSAGNWRLPLSAALSDGAHAITATATDRAGNTGPASAAATVTVDTDAPAAPTVSGLTAATDTGTSDADDITKNNAPTIEGTAEAGATVSVYDGSTLLGTATASPDGDWSLPLTAAMADGVHALSAVATDAAGNASAASAAASVTVKTSTDTPTVNGLVAAGATTPVSGTAAPNVTVTIVIDGGAPATETTDARGNWTHTPGTALTTGNHTIELTATDVAGNQATSGSVPLVVAGVPPAPKVTGLTTTTDSGVDDADNLTNVVQPTVTGTAEAGASVTVYVDGDAVGTVTADGNGDWSLALGADLSENTHVIRAISVDGNGTPSGLSAALTVVVDTTAPEAPVIKGLDPATDTGVSDVDAVTARPTPVLTGVAEAHSTVAVFQGATQIATTTADGDGNWRVTLPGLGDGAHALTARATDAAGNTGAASDPFTVTLDTAAPAAPAISGLTAATDSGTLDDDHLTNVNEPVLTGTAEANALVAVYEGTSLVGRAQADGTGAWSLPITGALADGSHTFTATATDRAGNAGPASAGRTITVDTVAPGAPTIAGLTAATDAGVSNSDGLTNVTTPTIAGTAEAFATVHVYDGATLLGTVTASDSGAWSFEIPADAPLADGAHRFTATATDAAGNLGPASAAKAVTVVSSMVAPTIEAVASGPSSPIKGTSAPSVTLTLVLDGQDPVLVQADESGNWTYTPPAPLAAGSHTVSVTASDDAGNSAGAGPATITVVAGPDAPTVVGLTAATDTGVSSTDGITKDSTPTVHGTTKAGTTVKVYIDGVEAGDASVTGTSWTLPVGSPHGEGPHTVTAIAADAFGTESGSSNTARIVVDGIAPGVPIVHGLTPDSGKTATNTNNTHPTITGKAEANALVTVYDGATVIGTTYADRNGNWKLKPVAEQTPGTHNWQATATDEAGNVSAKSGLKAVKVETAPPAAPTVALEATSKTGTSANATSQTMPKLALSGEAGATVSVYVDGKKDGTAVLGTDGTAEYQVGRTLKGAHQVTVVQTTLEGNTSDSSAAFDLTYKGNKLHHPVAIHLTEDTDTGTSAHDRVTGIDTPTIYGRSMEPGSFVYLYENEVLIGTTQINPDKLGTWSFTPTTPLTPGEHLITAKTVDDAGNISKGTGHIKVTIVDSGPPAPTTLKLDPSGDSGVSQTDGITKNPMPVVKAVATPGTKVQVYVDGVADGAPELVMSNGNVMHQLVSPLADGAHTITMRAVDAIGNPSLSSAGLAVQVLTSTATPTVSATASGAETTLTGTASPNATVSLVIDGAAAVTTDANASGAWSYTPAVALTADATVVATATDKAGNTATAASQTVTVGGGAVINNAIGLADDTNSAPLGDLETMFRTPTLAGQVQGVSSAQTITLTIGSLAPVSVTTDASGNWSYTPLNPLTIGAHTVSATGAEDVTLTIAAGGPSIAINDVTNATSPSFVVVGLANLDGQGTSTTFTVVGFTTDHGTWHLKTNNGQANKNDPLLLVGDTFTESNISNNRLGYNKASDGIDSLTVKYVDNGIWVQGTLYISNGGVTFKLVPDDAGALPDALAADGAFTELQLDFDRTLAGVPAKDALSVAGDHWKADLGAIIRPVQPADVEHALLARVVGPATPAPSVFDAPGDATIAAINLVRDASHVTDGLAAPGNAFTHLLDHTGYQFQ